jgi:hypothetical protein
MERAILFLIAFSLLSSAILVSFPSPGQSSAPQTAAEQPISTQTAPQQGPKQWALLTNGRGEQGTLPELMTIKVCEKIARFIESEWRDTAICVNLTTGEIKKLSK